MTKLCPYCGEVLIVNITAGMPYCKECWHVIEKREPTVKKATDDFIEE
jgi:hypothetical protein